MHAAHTRKAAWRHQGAAGGPSNWCQVGSARAGPTRHPSEPRRQDRAAICAAIGKGQSDAAIHPRRSVLLGLLGCTMLVNSGARAEEAPAAAPQPQGSGSSASPDLQPPTPPSTADSSNALPPDSSSVTTAPTPSPPPAPPSPPPPSTSTPVPLDDVQLSDAAVNRLMQEEEDKRKLRRRKKGRIRELEEIRGELAEKEIILLQKEQELLAKEESVMVLKEQLELERKLRALLSKEKEKAEEEAALAMGLCTGGAMLP